MSSITQTILLAHLPFFCVCAKFGSYIHARARIYMYMYVYRDGKTNQPGTRKDVSFCITHYIAPSLDPSKEAKINTPLDNNNGTNGN